MFKEYTDVTREGGIAYTFVILKKKKVKKIITGSLINHKS